MARGDGAAAAAEWAANLKKAIKNGWCAFIAPGVIFWGIFSGRLTPTEADATAVGSITPPLGLNLFVVSGLTGDSILDIAASAAPFVFFMLLVVLLIAYVPWVSAVLPPAAYQ